MSAIRKVYEYIHVVIYCLLLPNMCSIHLLIILPITRSASLCSTSLSLCWQDLIQQRASDVGTVSLVERCARFHLLCAARLCEEARHDFEPKLNQEQVNNCLKTLAELYDDLYSANSAGSGSSATSSNVLVFERDMCPNEPEFRAYALLMNLHDERTFAQCVLSTTILFYFKHNVRNTIDLIRE